jgi:hypothetical protein
VARYVFHMQVKDGQQDELRRLNERYEPALARAADGIEGFRGVEKYLRGDDYVEVIDYDGAFEEFGQQLASDPETREFLRSVGRCFEQSLRDMGERRMEALQEIGGGRSDAA